METNPDCIAISKSKGITVNWKDGHASRYGLEYLRENCPCATCTGAHGAPPTPKPSSSPFRMYKPVLKVADVESMGNYAIRIIWSDGHGTGIYSFEYFRQICPCDECEKEGDRTPPPG